MKTETIRLSQIKIGMTLAEHPWSKIAKLSQCGGVVKVVFADGYAMYLEDMNQEIIR